MRFATVNGHEINADNVDEVYSEWCGACSWHYNIVVLMAGGNKIIVEDVVWHADRWGEFEWHSPRLELGQHHIKERVEAVKAMLAPPRPPVFPRPLYERQD